MQGIASPAATRYALAGLLAIRPWPACELVGQSQRGPGFLWPRAESKVYEPVKRLTVPGLASAERQRHGRRSRTAGPEFTAAIKASCADQGGTHDALATLAAVTERAQRMQAIGQELLNTGAGPFPERLHINALIYEFLLRHVAMVSDWAAWAAGQVRDWNRAGPHRRDADLDSYRRGAAIPVTAGPAAPTPPRQASR